MGNINFLVDNAGTHVSLNGEILEANYYRDIASDNGYWASGIAYEVIRVIRGVPMYLEDHCVRLNESLQKLKVKTEIDISAIAEHINSLLLSNGEDNCNVKLWAAEGAPGAPNLFMNVNKSFYPPRNYYANGVPVGLFEHTREDPNVKKFVDGFKDMIQPLIDSGGVFELLLYDASRRMTEGSRSNLFFTRGDELYTAPDWMILKGTIRKYVFIAAKRAGIEIVERPVTLEEFGLSPGSLARRRNHGATVSDRAGGAAYDPLAKNNLVPLKSVIKPAAERSAVSVSERFGGAASERFGGAASERGDKIIDRRDESILSRHDDTILDIRKKENDKEKTNKSNKAIVIQMPDENGASRLPVPEFTGAFLTGTSIGVLPISRIGGVKLKSAKDDIVRAIMNEYAKIEREYIDARLDGIKYKKSAEGLKW